MGAGPWHHRRAQCIAGAARAQPEPTLERLHWLPDFGLSLLIPVNLPAYRLWALHDSSNGAPLEMRVVVGSALKTKTSLFVGQMR
jgi:murein L,D-transpeptidase YcbB/YkuD